MNIIKLSNKLRCKRGITLIELIITISLMVVIIGAVAMFIRPMRGLFALNQQSVEFKEQSMIIFNVLEGKMKKASYVKISDYVGEESFDEAKNSLFVDKGVLYLKVKNQTRTKLIDEKLYQPYDLHLRYRATPEAVNPTSKSKQTTLQVDVMFLTKDGVVVYETTFGFELLNMVLDKATLVSESITTSDYVQLLTFEE